MATERRTTRRLDVTGLDELVIEGAAPEPVTCRIRDMSPFGMRLNILNEKNHRRPGETMRIAECPTPLQSLLRDQELVLVWTRRREWGVRFATPLPCDLDVWQAQATFVRL
ncbi:hypothetical protein dsat_0969 [Alkalidesulfovibrio alkalitolerans DSM 16529]|uniref:Type IV pilus assembly PilZ n=1 Tax=Alkalidesulfovibrio alkalitolerans DSM 16529 TaxID=1121439 RepID=S7T4I5_9BACT|nr:hypothetical protein [Alkalidesulfovibrio alkalitolerans]EPR31380.1 hypothetical protein dsat_0969 [Alkalidesulfovibrio alkalitolerans DSM 16529]